MLFREEMRVRWPHPQYEGNEDVDHWRVKPQGPPAADWEPTCVRTCPSCFTGNGPRVGPLSCSRWRQHGAEPAGRLPTEVSETGNAFHILPGSQE